MKWKSILFFLLLGTCVNGEASLSCSSVLKHAASDELVTSGSAAFLSQLAKIPEPFKAYRDKGIFNRFWARDEVARQALEMATAPAGKEHFLKVSEQLRMKYTILRKHDAVQISIPVVRVTDVELGGRTKGMSLDFAKFMTGVLRAIEQEKLANPALKYVRLDANKVMNADLILLLEGLGFVHVQRSTLVDLVLDFELL